MSWTGFSPSSEGVPKEWKRQRESKEHGECYSDRWEQRVCLKETGKVFAPDFLLANSWERVTNSARTGLRAQESLRAGAAHPGKKKAPEDLVSVDQHLST